MAGISDHREFDVWKLSDQVRLLVRPITERGCFRRKPRLRDQLEEAAESPCPLIAEGFARFYPKEFGRFLRLARGSLAEVSEHTGVALAHAFVSQPEHDEICELSPRAQAAAAGLINYLEGSGPMGRQGKRGRR